MSFKHALSNHEHILYLGSSYKKQSKHNEHYFRKEHTKVTVTHCRNSFPENHSIFTHLLEFVLNGFLISL